MLTSHDWSYFLSMMVWKIGEKMCVFSVYSVNKFLMTFAQSPMEKNEMMKKVWFWILCHAKKVISFETKKNAAGYDYFQLKGLLRFLFFFIVLCIRSKYTFFNLSDLHLILNIYIQRHYFAFNVQHYMSMEMD